MCQKIKIKKNTIFEIMPFLWIDFSAQFFGKMALKKIQDRIQFKIYVQKSIERKILLQKSLFRSVVGFSLIWKIEMQEFPNFQNLQFVKNTAFSKFSQNLSFYFKNLRPKKKLL
jgi:hypothetical protein